MRVKEDSEGTPAGIEDVNEGSQIIEEDSENSRGRDDGDNEST